MDEVNKYGEIMINLTWVIQVRHKISGQICRSGKHPYNALISFIFKYLAFRLQILALAMYTMLHTMGCVKIKNGTEI